MKVVELFPKVIIYRDLIDDPEKGIEESEENGTWEDWYDIGKIYNSSVYGENAVKWENVPSEEELENWVSNLNTNDEFLKMNFSRVYKVILKALDHYFKENPIELRNGYMSGFNILKYDPKGEEELTNIGGGRKDSAINYHTDRDNTRENEPGEKPLLTITIYLNDNYEGGDINFAIHDASYPDFFQNNGFEDKKAISHNPDVPTINFSHKPEAGDIVIFPSSIPFYHSVTKITKGNKYLVRANLMELY